MLRLALLLALGAACSSSGSYPASAGPSSQIGASAPELALRDQRDAEWRIGDALARRARVMLVFYRGDW